MFTQELKVVRKMANLTDELYRAGSDMDCDGENMRILTANLESFAMGSDEVDWNINSMVRRERELAQSLAKFDKVLARIIEERAKLG